MAGHVQDRWFRTDVGPDGKPRKVKTDRHGLGMRYRARYVGPDGTEKSKSLGLLQVWVTGSVTRPGGPVWSLRFRIRRGSIG
jgi:hypothetical protein